ncbi:hypothetical protein AAFF_G00135780 [Aldrovandia affinis]|uniref:Uncharacterized protein n=1 Tax=Aldrovandia affinis TaxID=143900 RepID=A0AAD7RQC9_9TELE|nr:hypothetical protein AAFF_G00135780 [Aldrovandia affinis]
MTAVGWGALKLKGTISVKSRGAVRNHVEKCHDLTTVITGAEKDLVRAHPPAPAGHWHASGRSPSPAPNRPMAAALPRPLGEVTPSPPGCRFICRSPCLQSLARKGFRHDARVAYARLLLTENTKLRLTRYFQLVFHVPLAIFSPVEGGRLQFREVARHPAQIDSTNAHMRECFKNSSCP